MAFADQGFEKSPHGGFWLGALMQLQSSSPACAETGPWSSWGWQGISHVVLGLLGVVSPHRLL